MTDSSWMRKHIILGAALFVLAGCGGGQTEELAGPTGQADEFVEDAGDADAFADDGGDAFADDADEFAEADEEAVEEADEFAEADAADEADFGSCLAQVYQDGAQSKIDSGNWDAADWLTEKSEAVLRAEEVEPSTGESRELDESMSLDFADARDELVNTVAEYRSVRPCACGQAQGFYDVWLVEATINFGGADDELIDEVSVSDAESRFRDSLSECATGSMRVAEADEEMMEEEMMEDEAMGDEAMGDEVMEDEAMEAEAMPMAAETGDIIAEHTLYFDFNSSQLDDESDTTLEDVADLVSDYDDYLVKITGHTDTAGPSHYNVLLGHRRSKAVAQALLDKGVSKTSTHSQGETKPAVPTEDDVREAENRRAEIIVYAP